MKKLWVLTCLLVMAVPMTAHEIDSLYIVFLANRGDNAVRLANEIATMAGDTATFTAESSIESINGRILKMLVFWHYYRSEMMEVINYSNKAIEQYRQQNDLRNMAGCYIVLGVSYQRMGKFEEAIDCYNHCNELMMQLNQQEPNSFYQINIRYNTNNMAAIYSSMGEFDIAEDMYSKCIDLLGELKDDRDYQDMATYLQNLADIYLSQSERMEGEHNQEKASQAVSLAERALGYSVEHNDLPGKMIQRMIVVSRAYFAVGRSEDASRMLEEALQLAENESDIFFQAEIETLFGRFAFEEGRFKDSESHYNKAITLAKEGCYEECLLNAYRGAYETSKMFDLRKALDYFEQSVALKDSIFNENQQALIRDYQVKYDLAEKEFQLEIQQKNNRLQEQKILVLLILVTLLIVILIILVLLISAKKKQNETLARLNDTQNRILSVASHEVKNSVLAQNMVLKLANDHFDSMGHDELKEKIAALKVSSDELKDSLYALLHWIYSELGKETDRPDVFNLLQTVEAGIKPHSDELKFKKLTVITDIRPQLKCFDKLNVFNIVFQNLISNAIKFSKQGGEITVRAVVDNRQVWVEVIDHGIGISKDRMQGLLRDRVEPTQGTNGECGSGIGLSVSQQLMRKNGGLILIDSEEGKGTSIRFNVKTA